MMYSKEQLIDMTSGFITHNLGNEIRALSQHCIIEMEAREAAERKIAILEYALRDMAGDIVWTRDCIDKCVSDYINGAEEALKEEAYDKNNNIH